jgi:Trk K+ transport system NAD-binding subunit
MESGGLVFIIVVLLVLAAWIYVAVKKPDNTWLRSAVKATFVVLVIILTYAVIYQQLMRIYENEEKTYAQSVQVVVESITTAGYGGDSPWTSDVMNYMVLIMNLTGVVLVFFALPMFLVPLIREAMKPKPLQRTYKTDHIIICSHSRRAAVLKKELTSKRIPFIVIDKDRETVLELNKQGIDAMEGNPADEAILKAANIEQARSLVTDFDDESNAVIALTARHLRDDLQIITIASDLKTSRYHRYAGANEVINPREVLGKGLAEKVIVNLSSEIQGITKIGEELEIAEILVETDSKLDGMKIGDTDLRDIEGAELLGLWESGEFIPNPGPDQSITGETILLFSGSHNILEQVSHKTSTLNPNQTREVIIAGYGLVGQTVKKYLSDNNIPNRVLDKTEMDDVDFVGDITDEGILKEAIGENTSSVVLAVSNDDTAIYATLILRNLNPDMEIIARANEPTTAAKLYRAGADYVLNLSTVSGRMIFSAIVESDIILSSDTNYEVVRTAAPKLVGIRPDTEKIREITGSSIVMVKRGAQSITEFPSDFEIQTDDELIIVGSDDTINKFRTYYC